MANASTTEAGRRLRDMMQIFYKKAPRLRPNLVPKSCKPFMDVMAMCSTGAQRDNVQRTLEQQKSKLVRRAIGADGDGDRHLTLKANVNLDKGTCNIYAATYVSQVEADLYSTESILNMHSRGDNDELRIRLEYFLSVNGYDGGKADMIEAQEVYSLAYAIIICLSAAPFKATVGPKGLALPLSGEVDAGAVILALFGDDAHLNGYNERTNPPRAR
ncbi:hypothetical protein NSK_002443 [Nannochloropsis salina CCMP1776]|uniref:Uncharacterized protein n=1 Tax=Nannochloropsis salina CCMP1776 TaxID=1027361 RepID=A0A4D9D9U4_9STRA|nr:hypothetical protein NSK_002443 [Nannochloropsis salina CCMP1776]|eukprot:TFJ86235.1 hypothetical protein NSK_002443 [Nannochloropsis salina CCMP1776]